MFARAAHAVTTQTRASGPQTVDDARVAVSRRKLIALVGGTALFGGAWFGRQRIARASAPSGPLSEAAKGLLDRAWQGLDPKRVLDTHVHVLGNGSHGSGCYLNKRMTTVTNPWEYFKFSIYETA